MTADKLKSVRCLIVIPCLNEEKHIEGVIANLARALNDLNAEIVVADGGSRDQTQAIVTRIAADNPKVRLLDNPKRIQSAAVNLAVAQFGSDYDYLIRIDAHGTYPQDYCQTLVTEALETGADSVVVGMLTVGFGTFQRATALAQNSKLGNGGSKHRTGAKSHWTDHGHHALVRIAAYKAIGGYDEAFRHNEDAEFDYRLNKAGFRVWMTANTNMTYYPRSRPMPLYRQYYGYGRGRAQNTLKHRSRPSLRQLIPLAVAPVVVFALVGMFFSWLAIVPALLWALACLGYGAWLSIGARQPLGPLAAVSAMIMHFAWSAGFWCEILDMRSRKSHPMPASPEVAS
ncbi:glycosyltransferase family 2 protein [Allorhizobium taibaishanense]|uniref:Succinoglycan biosynthesis protein ExoA n=1 Tax=Allorhizobium taibaishanense TaxID=887144 RepID=A0A1Q9ABT4_9HYPH|nr:glycosyltransferase family 2 protein [Allorhizobium taibaishanense]MBB4010584.1 succinoglycan biosynthesis protein ExoA [Allorhizobium taibaishanense]OLP52311.1 succinoglycan biosynthesis protein exoa [Allorhizobium taibaishanense]